MATGEELFKLPMRHWLPTMVDSGQLKGLEWIDDDKTFLKIPWTKKGYPGFESCQNLVQAWAAHQGRNEEEGKKSDFSTLKANFRNAIHKSEDFKEEISLSQLDNQSGNYKVYKRLSREEVEQIKEEKRKDRARKRKTKLQNAGNSKLVCSEKNFDDGQFKTIEKDDLDFALWSPEENVPQASTSDMTSSIQSDSVGKSLNQIPGSMDAGSSYLSNMQFNGNLDPPSQYQYSSTSALPNQVDCYPPIVQNLPPISALQCTSDYNGPSGDLFMETTMIPCSEDMLTLPNVTGFQSAPSLVPDLCRIFSITYENLPECEITVTYNSSVVLQDKRKNTQHGYRIFYGNEERLKTVLKMHQISEEGLSDYEYPAISLPHAREDPVILQKILDKTDLGLVFRYDSQSHSFMVKRLCQSQIFFVNPHAQPQSQVPIKMNRQEEVRVFSYEIYLKNFMESVGAGNQDSSSFTNPVIYISIGSKSNLQYENQSPRGIKLEIRPCALQRITEECISSGNTSLYFSQALPVEEMLREMKGVSISGD